MATQKGLYSGLGLVAIGAVATLAVTHVRLGWQRSEAAPAAPVADVKPALPPPSPTQISEARSLGRTFAQVASQLSPSVVRIEVTKKVRGMNMGPFGSGRDNPFRHFFGPQGPGDDDEGGDLRQGGMGSGVVIDARGYILTNNHVVQGADELKVGFADGKKVSAKLIGTDPKSDLAIVKVEGEKVTPARFGDSDRLQIGEWTIAIGNPFGLDHTVTVGVLSAKGRRGFGMTQYEDFLQTDASINPGNSGGPLVNLDGEIIGINTMIRGIGTGIGFAVPSSMAKPIAEQLMNGGKVRRPYIGIMMEDLRPEVAKAFGDKAPEKGAIVNKVQPGSPADKAGFKSGDVIVRIDGKDVDGSSSVQKTILGKQIGQRIEVAIWREGKEQRLSTATGELPAEAGEERASSDGQAPSSRGKLGLALENVSPQIAEQLELPRGTRGAVVAQVRPGSPAQEAGLQTGDVIVEVDRRAVGSADEAVRLLGQARAGGHLVRVVAKGMTRYLVLQS